MIRVADPTGRVPIGIWTEWPRGGRWTNEGMTRLLGFLIEGAAQLGRYIFHVVVTDSVFAEAKADLMTLAAHEGIDFVVHHPGLEITPAEDFSALALFANRRVPVEGWLVLYPYFSHARLLDRPIVTIFPDAIPLAFPLPDQNAWGRRGYHDSWRREVRRLLAASQRVVTFSQHVANDHAIGYFGVDPSRITVVSHAPPDLAHLLPFVDNRQRTDESRRQAADLLRAAAKARGSQYLADFPFENTSYVVVSTQDRVTKNISVVAQALRILIRERRSCIKLIVTAAVDFGSLWTLFPHLYEDCQLKNDIISFNDLPRVVHAALYHCADLAVHSSRFEGGDAPFPFYESVSVGTPCLMARGPHVSEIAEREPTLATFSFDADDADGLANLIHDTIETRQQATNIQHAIFERQSKRTWNTVAADYIAAIIDRDDDVL